MTESSQPTGISRRTLVKGAAWSVPIIAVGPALPAFAFTPGFFELDGKSCKLPGASADTYKGYAFGFTANNTNPFPVTITILSIFIDTDDLGDVIVIQTDPSSDLVCDPFPVNTITIPAGTLLTDLVALTQNASNSQQGTLVVTYQVQGETQTTTATAPVTPPIQGAVCDDFTEAQKDCLTTFV